MELISIILTFLGAYGLFMFMAYMLARALFPTIEVDDGEEKNKHIKTRYHQSKRLSGRTMSKV